MVTLWLWACASAVLLQLISQHYSLEFSGNTHLFASSDSLLYAAVFNRSFSVLLWVKVQIQPTASSMVFLSIEKSGSVGLSIRKETNGDFVVFAKSACLGIVSTTHAGPTAPEWVHLGVIVDSRGPTLTLGVTVWDNFSTSFVSTPNTETFEAYDPADTTITLGNALFTVSRTQGQMLDLVFADYPLSRNFVSFRALDTPCHDQCPGNCSGPGDKSCSKYIQLTEEVTPSTTTTHCWNKSDPHLQGLTSSSTKYSFTGWYFITALGAPTHYSTLFRTLNVLKDTATPGQHLIHIIFEEVPRCMVLYTDTTTGYDLGNKSCFVVSLRRRTL